MTDSFTTTTTDDAEATEMEATDTEATETDAPMPTVIDEDTLLDEQRLAESEDAAADVDAESEEELGDEDDVEEEPVESPYDRPGQWFVVHTYAGYENKVKSNLNSRIASMNMEERIFEVVIPMEDVIEFKNGKKVVVQKKVFPGYLLVRCDLDDDSWY